MVEERSSRKKGSVDSLSKGERWNISKGERSNSSIEVPYCHVGFQYSWEN